MGLFDSASNVGQFGANDSNIIRYKQAAEYAQDAKDYADLSGLIYENLQKDSDVQLILTEMHELQEQSKQSADDSENSAIRSEESAEKSLEYKEETKVLSEDSKISALSAEIAAEKAESVVDTELTFDSVTEGISGTSDGQYFRIPQGTGPFSFIYYRNTSGIAVEVSRLIGQGSISNSIRTYKDITTAQNDLVNGNILSGSLLFIINSSDNILAEEYLNRDGILELTGRIVPSSVTIDDKLDKRLPLGDFKASMFPLCYDVNGNVPAWFDESRFDVADLGPNIQNLIKNMVGVNSSGSFLEGDQFKFIFKRGRVASGQPYSLNVAFTGDSWTEKNTIPQSLINILGGSYKDPGWISCSTRTDGVMAGITLVTSGFTKYDGDNENTGSAPPYGSGPDGNAYWNNNATGTLTWSNVKATDLSVFYYDGSGTFTVSVDGTLIATIVGQNTGTSIKHDITGLSSSAHTVVITSSGTGVVSIFGMYGKNSSISSGITVSRMGNGGAMASDYPHWKNWIKPVVSNLDLDLLFIILGTNDYRKSAGTSEYINGIQMIIDQYKLAIPGICICLISPAQSNATGTPALVEYDDAMRNLAVSNKVNFISLYNIFPKTYDNSNSAWVDALHLSDRGAYVLARKIKDQFFKE